MIPLSFGSRERLLFGLYSPGANPRRRQGVILLNPWGVEMLRAHRSMKYLSDLLARDGFDVLRFDYFGTGDSFGTGADVTLKGWVDDAECALDELVGVAGVSRLSVVGLRLGALVAARLAALHPRDVEQVVLWDPLPDGQACIEEWCRALGKPEASLREYEGFELPPVFLSEIRAAGLDGLPGTRARVLLGTSGDGLDAAALGLKAGGIDVVSSQAPKCWERNPTVGAGVIPTDLIREFTQWLR